MFQIKSSFQPTGDQPKAIDGLVKGIQSGAKDQVLLGVTGSGKTFTIANVIQKLQLPTLIISHNKTLAGQLYQEFRDFFPDNAVSYFVSYYDYYQPEAYIPQSDTYIEKEADINERIDKLRLQTTTNILTRKDVIVVASVSCIYNIGSSVEYWKFILEITIGEIWDVSGICRKLVELQYDRSEYEFKRGTFRMRGNYLDIFPAYENFGYRIYTDNKLITRIEKFDPLTGVVIHDPSSMIHDHNTELTKIIIFPAKHYMTDPAVFTKVEKQIRADLLKESNQLRKENKLVEAQRITQKVNFDLEMIKEVGYVNGIENYSRYFDGRNEGDPPYTLLDYFKQTYGKDYLVCIDESHMTVPQIRGMFNGDFSRKSTLIDFGFRLHSALDNRPLKFDEFYKIPPKIIYISATPNDWEVEKSKGAVVEQLVRPTGIIDPVITIRKAETEVQDLLVEIEKRVKNNEKVLVTTLTKKNAEDLSIYFKEKSVRAAYLHSDIHTLERSDVLDNLRKGEFDVLIGVNLLREGLDLPEVSLVVILDADKEGFLRSRTSLVQTIGRAARNIKGEVILYADQITKSMRLAIDEIERRRNYQLEYNNKHNIDPKTIYKPIREKITDAAIVEAEVTKKYIKDVVKESLTPYDTKKVIKKLEKEMLIQADNLNFEMAIMLRDKINELKEV